MGISETFRRIIRKISMFSTAIHLDQAVHCETN